MINSGKKHRRLKYLVRLNIFCVVAFVLLLVGVSSNSFIVDWDNSVQQFYSHSDNPTVQKALVAITTIANILPFLVLSILLAILILYEHKAGKLGIFFFSAFFSLISGLGLKHLVGRIRPPGPLIEISGLSFPSNHANMAIVLFSILIFTFSDDIRSKSKRYFFIITNVLLFLLIGFSRIYLHVHWFSDVIAGFALGFFWFSFIVILNEKGIVRKLKRKIHKLKFNNFIFS